MPATAQPAIVVPPPVFAPTVSSSATVPSSITATPVSSIPPPPVFRPTYTATPAVVPATVSTIPPPPQPPIMMHSSSSSSSSTAPNFQQAAVPMPLPPAIQPIPAMQQQLAPPIASKAQEDVIRKVAQLSWSSIHSKHSRKFTIMA